MKNLLKLAKKIKNLRENMGVSQEEFAHKIGLSRVAISQFETGKRGLNAIELIKIAEFFDVSIDFLLKDERNEDKRTESVKCERPVKVKTKFNEDKLKNLILYVLEKCGGKPNVGETVLYKLLYFIDFDSFEISGRPITGMNYVKMQFGPVPNQGEYRAVIEEMVNSKKLQIIDRDYYGMPQKRYIALINSDISYFNAKEVKTIDEVINKLSDMNARQIEDYVHGDAPWDIAEEKEIIPYNLVFERVAPYAHFDYQKMMQDAAAEDTLKHLGPISKKEADYYNSL